MQREEQLRVIKGLMHHLDNGTNVDAGGQVRYANFTKTTRMLEKLRHYNPRTYTRLMLLSADFERQGELYRYVQTTFGLNQAQFRQIIHNTQLAAGVLRESCRSGRLQFDLDPELFLIAGQLQSVSIDCDVR